MALMIPGEKKEKRQAIAQIKETGSLIIEKEVIREVPVQTIVEVIREVIVEKPVEVIKTVYIQQDAEIVHVDKIVYVDKIIEIEKEVFVDRVVEVVKEVAIPYKVTNIEELRKKDLIIASQTSKIKTLTAVCGLLFIGLIIIVGVR